MVIDYCPGGDLSLLLAQHNNFEPEVARFYICELILAIENLHKLGVLYRDLKPENILLDSEGHIKLADFGLSKVLQSRGEIAKSFCGSPIYLSPEMVSQKGYTEASDLYGIGLVLYEMIFSLPPFYTEDIPALYSKIKKSKLTFPWEVKDALGDLMHSLLKKEPKERLGVGKIDDIKTHPFFAGIDWDKVLKRGYEPPFKGEPEQREQRKRILRINDKDYTAANWDFMRVKGFEFVRESEVDGKIIDERNSFVDNSDDAHE